MAPRSKSRKQAQQTHLTFTPLSSSPATRHANVRYESPRQKLLPSRRLGDASVDAENKDEIARRSSSAFLNPEVSSPVDVKVVEESAEILPTHSRILPRNVENVLVSSGEDQDDDDDDVVAFSSSRRHISSSANHKIDSDDTIRLTPSTSKETRKSGDMRGQGLSTPRRSGRLTAPQTDSNATSPSSTISVEIVSPRRNIGASSPRTTFSRNHASQSSPPKKLLPKRTTIDLRDSDMSEDEADFVATQPTKTKNRRSSARGRDAFVVADHDIEYDTTSNEDDQVQQSFQPRRRNNAADSEAQSESESEVDLTTPSKRKREISTSLPKKSPRSVRHKNRQEAQEIAEDLEDLRSSSPLQRTRTRGKVLNTARDRQQKLLEQLKRKRVGNVSSGSEGDRDHEDPEGDFRNGDPSHISEHPSNPIEILSDSDLSSSNASKSAQRGLQRSDQQDLDADDEDFIVSDPEEDTLGVPTASLPFEFSHHASARPREHFKYVVEWLVKNKIAPAFRRHDQMYDVAFKKVNDEIQGQAGSRYRSAAWNREFVTVLDARPQMQMQEYDVSDALHPVCDACKRTNHPATWEMSFTGKPYDKDTLEPIDREDDDDDAEEDDGAEYDMKGNLLPPETKQYYLGRYCAFNADMTHKLSHWKWHLNDWLLDFLESQDVLSADSIVAREKLSQKKREDEANTVVDGMEENGEMDRLWRDFKSDKERAREGMEDDQGRQSTLLRGKNKGRYGGGLNMFARP
ncbi:MAG: hypothetical protein Q9160_002290 [Pyrenula sp. 1 TL-2023]